MHTESVIRTDEVGIPPTRSMEWKIAGKPTIIWVYRTLIRRVNPRVALSLSTSLRRQVESFTRIDSLPLRLRNVEVIVMPKKPVGGVNSFSIICRHFLHVLLKSAGKLFVLVLQQKILLQGLKFLAACCMIYDFDRKMSTGLVISDLTD